MATLPPSRHSTRERVAVGLVAGLLVGLLTATPLSARAGMQPDAEARALLLAQRAQPDAAAFRRALALAERAVVETPDRASAWTTLAWTRMQEHRFADALAAAEKAQTQAQALAGDDPVNLALMCDALVELGRYPEAVATAQRLIDLRPGPPAWIRGARLRFLHNDLPGAIALMTQAAQGGGRGEAAAWTWLELSQLHLHAGDTTAAEAALAAARRAQPDLAALLPAEARLSLARGDREAALKLYRLALAAQPNAEDALAAWRLARQLGRDGVARHQAALLDGIARLDGAVLSRRALADYFADSGRSQQALVLARQEFAARPDIYSHASLARALASTGASTGTASDMSEARHHARLALALNTPDPALRAKLDAILAQQPKP